MDLNLVETDMKSAMRKGEPFELKFSNMTREATDITIKIMNILLLDIGKTFMKEEIVYLLREFITNANKSNLKRIYFARENLDINNPTDYRNGMEKFGDDFRANLESYNRQFESLSLYTRIVLHLKERILTIAVKNSNCPTTQEMKKVWDLIEKSKFIRNTAEAFMTVGDTSEGAGLGTVSTMLMLRSLGLNEKVYKFDQDTGKNETIVSVEIPIDTVTDVQAGKISDEIVKEIDCVPAFPENVSRIQKLIANDNVQFNKVSEIVQSDPALTASLLKIVNSAQYMLSQRVSNITNAISLIGMKGLKNLLYSYGSQQIFEKNYGKMDRLWEHSFRCASYAYNIAREYKMNDIRDDAYIGGVLHDIGKIIIYHLHPGLLEKIHDHCSDKGIDGNLLENLSMGVSHTRIGSEIAGKWNFPGNIVDIIGFHHQPLIAPDETRNIVSVVYLANQLCKISTGGYNFIALEPSILEKFHLQSDENLRVFEKKLDGLYLLQKSKVREN